MMMNSLDVVSVNTPRLQAQFKILVLIKTLVLGKKDDTSGKVRANFNMMPRNLGQAAQAKKTSTVKRLTETNS